MIWGDDVLIKIGGEIIALQKSCTMNASVEMTEVVPLPGSDEDDGWAHYERGEESWTVSNDSFLTINDRAMALGIDGDAVTVEIGVGALKLTGTAVVKKVKMTAQHKTYATVSLSLDGEDLPTLEEV